LIEKEEALKDLEVVVQEPKQSPFVATMESFSMEEKVVARKGVCSKSLKYVVEAWKIAAKR
jgi:hypothetical protein